MFLESSCMFLDVPEGSWMFLDSKACTEKLDVPGSPWMFLDVPVCSWTFLDVPSSA